MTLYPEIQLNLMVTNRPVNLLMKTWIWRCG